MRAEVALCSALAVGACGQAVRDSTGDASAGAAGTAASGGIGGLGAGGSGGALVGGGGVVGGSGGVLVGGGGGLVGGTAGQAGGGGASGSGATAGLDAGGGDGGVQACASPNDCQPDEYCASVNIDFQCAGSGWCAKRPKSCPGECWVACSCGGDWCSVCVSRLFGYDAAPFGSQCQGFGGASGILDAGLGAPCGWYQGTCATGLKCCYPCKVTGCQAACMPPDASGMCPTITPS